MVVLIGGLCTCLSVQALLRELLRCAVHSYKAVRERACGALESSLKRYPCLVPLCLPGLLLALAGLPQARSSRACGQLLRIKFLSVLSC
jgi:hypothetical protein